MEIKTQHFGAKKTQCLFMRFGICRIASNERHLYPFSFLPMEYSAGAFASVCVCVCEYVCVGFFLCVCVQATVRNRFCMNKLCWGVVYIVFTILVYILFRPTTEISSNKIVYKWLVFIDVFRCVCVCVFVCLCMRVPAWLLHIFSRTIQLGAQVLCSEKTSTKHNYY